MCNSPGLVDFAILFLSVPVLIKNICTTSCSTEKVASISYVCWRCNSVSFSPSKLCLFAKHLSLNSFYTKANVQLTRYFPFEQITDRFQLCILAVKTKFSLHANLPFSFISGGQKKCYICFAIAAKEQNKTIEQGKNEEEEGKKEGSRDLYNRISRFVTQPLLNPAH